jgi:L-histidine N-alpha-methyltransferase
VAVPALDLTVDIAEGEELRTEISAKFHPDGVKAELAAAGFTASRRWTDSYGRFMVTLAQAS